MDNNIVRITCQETDCYRSFYILHSEVVNYCPYCQSQTLLTELDTYTLMEDSDEL